MHKHKDTGHGLAADLHAMRMQQLRQRRRALRLLGSSGLMALLPGCGGGGDTATTTASSASATNSPASNTASTTASGTGTTATTGTTGTTGTASTGACIADPVETAGPYPADGTNTASGATSDILSASGIVRSDIRASFLTTTTVAAGVRMTMTLQLVNVNASCAPLAGYAIYLWHCDANGNYSLYTAAAESYLRGVQVTDANGQVSFTTIFPACYSGRYPHMHFEVFTSLAAASSGRNAVLTSQLCMPAAQCNAVFADTAAYPSSASRFGQVSIASDNVFGDNTAARIAQQTPAFSGSPTAGYSATALVGIAV